METLAVEEKETIDKVINPTQEKVDKFVLDVVAKGEEMSSIEDKIKQLKIQAESFESQAYHLNAQLRVFQDLYKHF